MNLLRPGDTFPTLIVTPVVGPPITLPGELAGHFGVVLFYRGAWCPYCNAQLRAFQRAKESLANVDAHVVALSVDDQATTEALITKHGLDFTVGYGADARAIGDVSGAFANDKPAYLQSTGFIIDPDERVLVSVYSSGAIGRLLPDDVIGMIRYLREHTDSVSA